MDKKKPAPIPEKTGSGPADKRADPKFVRGTFDPTTKKGKR